MSVMSAFAGRERRATVTIAWPVPEHPVAARGGERHDHAACGIASCSRVATPKGAVCAADLAAGDLVVDAKGKTLRVATVIRVASVLGTDRLKIRAGALGDGLPRADLVVGRRTRLVLRSELARRLVGRDDVLVAAEQLQGQPGISAAPKVLEDVTYLVLEENAALVIEGLSVESLVPTAGFMESLPRDLAEAAYADLPKMRYAGAAAAYATDLPELDRREACQILEGGCCFAAEHGCPDMFEPTAPVPAVRKQTSTGAAQHRYPASIALCQAAASPR